LAMCAEAMSQNKSYIARGLGAGEAYLVDGCWGSP
jgi:hypothetical protein